MSNSALETEDQQYPVTSRLQKPTSLSRIPRAGSRANVESTTTAQTFNTRKMSQ
jgi:hypothetical protein